MTRLKPHTVVVIRATFPFDSCEEYERLLRLPVSAYYTESGNHTGQGTSAVEDDEAEGIAYTLQDLAEMVASTPSPSVTGFDELRASAGGQVTELKRLLHDVERAVASDDVTELRDTTDPLKAEAFNLAMAIRSYDAEQEPD